MTTEFNQGEKSRSTSEENNQRWFEEFGDVLKALRGRASQHGLAALTGYSHSFVSRLESGARDPSTETVGIFADVLELNDIQEDRLLASAGLRGNGNTIRYNFVPMLEVNALLMSDKVPEKIKKAILADIGSIALKYASSIEKDGE